MPFKDLERRIAVLEDEPEEELLPLSAWNGFSFDTLTSDDDYDESFNHKHHAVRNESHKN